MAERVEEFDYNYKINFEAELSRRAGYREKGRPTPKLARLSQPVKGFVWNFQITNYER